MTLESDNSSIIKDSQSSTVTHVDITGGSESSHLILQDLQCDFRFDLVLVLLFQLFFSFSFVWFLSFFSFSFCQQICYFLALRHFTMFVFIFVNRNHTVSKFSLCLNSGDSVDGGRSKMLSVAVGIDC